MSRKSILGDSHTKGAGRVMAMVILLWIIFAFSSLLYAQQGGTVINSRPPGAFVTLEGEYSLSGSTPCHLPDNIVGSYKLVARLPGYETWRGEIMILPGQVNTFDFALAPKTRFKAVVRSLFLPGWGQHYAGQKWRSLLFGVTFVSAGISAVIADVDFRSKRTDYRQAWIDLQNARTYDEVIRLRALVREKNRQAYDAETLRDALAGLAIGIWGYNIIDALVFFPEHRLLTAQPRLQAMVSPDRVEFAWTTSF